MPLVEIFPNAPGLTPEPRASVSVRPPAGTHRSRAWIRLNAPLIRQARWEDVRRVRVLVDDEAGTAHLVPDQRGPFSLKRRKSGSAKEGAWEVSFPHPSASGSHTAEESEFSIADGKIVLKMPENLWSEARLLNIERARGLIEGGVSVHDVARSVRLPIPDLVRIEGEVKAGRAARQAARVSEAREEMAA